MNFTDNITSKDQYLFLTICFSLMKYLAVIGFVITLIFSIWWFWAVSSNCGVVRFYEYILGIIIIAGWLTGMVSGLIILQIGRRKQCSMFVAVGLTIVLMTNIGLTIVASKIIYGLYI